MLLAWERLQALGPGQVLLPALGLVLRLELALALALALALVLQLELELEQPALPRLHPLIAQRLPCPPPRRRFPLQGFAL
jgi:hypothetical protein